MLAKDVNDNAFFLNERVALEAFASKLAPTRAKGKRRLRRFMQDGRGAAGGIPPCVAGPFPP
ncbi:hypothetical protein ELQ88_12170 [Pseudomonas sp. MPC6]|nr:hypothetical protein ELQ88_12170 [Pseudomonas sp. MPC6]